MAEDLATLGLRVVNGQAVQAIKETETALQGLGRTAETSSAAYDKTTKKIEESRGKYEAWRAQIGQTQQIAQHVTHVNSMATAHDKAAFNANRLRGGLTNLASSVIGLNPQIATLSSVVGSFAVGSGLMVGVLAGVAALGLAYNELTFKSRAAKEASDDLVASLAKQKKSLDDATVAGRRQAVVTAAAAEADAFRAQLRLDETGPALPGTRARIEANLKRATDARIQAERNLNQTIGEERAAGIRAVQFVEEQVEKGRKQVVAEEKKAATERQRAADKYLATLIATAEAAGRAISPMGYGAFTFAGGLDLRPIGPITAFDREVARFQAPLPLPSGGPQTFQQRQQAEQWTRTLMGDFAPPVKKVGQEAQRTAQAMAIAANTIANTISAISGKIGGGGIAANFGGGLGQAAASMFGGFGGTVLGQAIFGPILGAFGSAVGAGVDAMFDFSGAAKAAKIALENMSRAVESNIANFEARAYGTEGSLADQIRRAQEEAEQRRAEIEAKYRAQGASTAFKPGQYAEAVAQRDAELARIDAAERALITRLKEEDAIKAVTEELNKLATSVRNAPSGFKIESYINRFAAGRPWDYPGGPMTQPFTPKGGPTGTGAFNISMNGVTFEIKGNTGEALLKDVANSLRKVAATTIGGNAPVEQAWEYV